MIRLKINHMSVSVPEGTTILEAAKTVNIIIPTLCNYYFPGKEKFNRVASCRVCLVEVKGKRSLAPSCATYVSEGMEVLTDTIRAIKARRTMVELLLSDHPKDCLICPKNGECELQAIAAELGLREIKYQGEMSEYPLDTSSLSLVKNLDKCIMCRRCEIMCNDIQTCNVYSAVGRGFDTVVSTAFNLPQKDTTCTYCGQCVAVCPTGALTEVNNVPAVWKALSNPKKYVVVQTAPAVRVALGELFGMPAGTIVTGQMVSALKRLGFAKVFDTNFGADLTIMEEASELVHRLRHGGRMPILTSCCPSWVKFFEHNFPDLLDIPSTCKSPHEMLGIITKTYFAEKMGINPDDIVVVSVMPCIAKKFEAARPELSNNTHRDVDIVITTRELGAMIKEAGINFTSLPDSDFDNPLGESTGAGVIFGVTGGVIEAALRTAYEWITNQPLPNINLVSLRGMEGVREATIRVGGNEIKIGIATGLGSARKLLESIRDGKAMYHAIEIMACPGGCIDGGGQPYHHGNMDIVLKRAHALYQIDRSLPVRKSHENVHIKKLYDEFLGKPYGEKAHQLLHTSYTKREKL